MIIYKICLLIIAFILATFLFVGLFYFGTCGKLCKKLGHDVIGWHLPSEEKTFNGCSFVSKCKFCGKEILQDWQGNWF